MKLKTGDRVKFLNDVGEGVIVSFLDKNKAIVRIKDGFEIPVMVAELVNYGGEYFTDNKEVESGRDRLTKDKHVQITAGEKPKDKDVPTVRKSQPAIIPDDEIVFALKPSAKHTGMNTWLVNSSSWDIKYIVSRPVDEGHLLFAEGVLESDTKVFLGRFSPENIAEVSVFDFQFLFYKPGIFLRREPGNVRIYLDPAGIYDGTDLHANDYFTEKAAVLSVVDFKKNKLSKTVYPDIAEIKNILAQKNDTRDIVKKEEKVPVGEKIEEVDLHIENLIEDHRNMSNGQIVEIQMARFKTALETAIIHKTPKIVFIHGVGNGKLKFEIRRTLDQKYPAHQYQDASFREYGFGATMVLVK